MNKETGDQVKAQGHDELKHHEQEAMGAMWWQMHWRQAAFESEMQVEMLGIPASPQTTLVPRSPFDTTLT